MSNDEGTVFSPARQRSRKVMAWVAIGVTVLVLGGGGYALILLLNA